MDVCARKYRWEDECSTTAQATKNTRSIFPRKYAEIPRLFLPVSHMPLSSNEQRTICHLMSAHLVSGVTYCRSFPMLSSSSGPSPSIQLPFHVFASALLRLRILSMSRVDTYQHALKQYSARSQIVQSTSSRFTDSVLNTQACGMMGRYDTLV